MLYCSTKYLVYKANTSRIIDNIDHVPFPLQVSECFMRRGERGMLILSIIACFGAGVFFGAYMMHLAPDVEYLLRVYWLEPNGIEYPFHQLFFGLGFFLLVFIEQAMHWLKGIADRREARKDIKANRLREENLDTGMELTLGGSPFAGEYGFGATVDQNTDTSSGMPQVTSQVSITDSMNELIEDNVPKLGALKIAVMFGALSSDCIFEGLSVGLQRTETGVWNLVIAILSHEVVIAFMLGLELLKHYSAKVTLWLGFLYALTAPIGIAIGTAIHVTLNRDGLFEMVTGILQGLCGGVFIYITFIEILSREFVGTNNNGIKTLAVFFGFAVMAALKLVPHGSFDESVGENNDTTTLGGQMFARYMSYIYWRSVW